MARPDHLRDLAACLRGTIPDGVDWTSVLAMANRSLITPTLAARLACARGLPNDVRLFLAAVGDRNRARNDRLLAQLQEAVEAFDACGIPVLLFKGAAFLATAEAAHLGDRMLADIDIAVRPDQVDAAVQCLLGKGYGIDRRVNDPLAAVVLSRSDDVGSIDLHVGVDGAYLWCSFEELLRHARPVEVGSATAMIPSATSQAKALVLHDQIKGRDYLRGLIDLRHLLDLERLARSDDGIDWALLSSSLPLPRTQRALKVQLFTARQLLELPVPIEFCDGPLARIQYQRRLLQARWPRLIAPLMLLTALLDPEELRSGRIGRAKERVGGAKPRRRWRAWQQRLRNIPRLMRTSVPGKV